MVQALNLIGHLYKTEAVVREKVLTGDDKKEFRQTQRLRWLTRLTLFFSEPGWLALALICLTFSYLCIHPRLVTEWLMR
ncbi:hypothetical protein [Sansalvadorimonas verongulae]|uniref:hypothetical protein n=1 Tax=Sansalvadorimonas verongulae TaxID=2172824 RepID=UPI0012BC7951|nr:hypothetical protein [Sansalvadorimonas verongulae]MTI14182.1 hypothetical protein [Sansalvadorimonas verongulae]